MNKKYLSKIIDYSDDQNNFIREFNKEIQNLVLLYITMKITVIDLLKNSIILISNMIFSLIILCLMKPPTISMQF